MLRSGLLRNKNYNVHRLLSSWIKGGALCCLFFLASTVITPALAQNNEQMINFDIPGQRLDLALTEFAKQANYTFLFPFELARQEQSQTLTGTFTVRDAIKQLLANTNLDCAIDQNGKIFVRERTNPDETSSAESVISVVENDTSPQADTATMEKIAVVGSRASARSVGDSAVPLDIIGREELVQQGSTDMLSMLTSVVPSFNVNDQPINDASSLVRPANLRGMASDHTLILVNGKRRHRSAVITFLGGGLSDGAQGPDISNIPASALKQVEILRDGAAAQYGSDAIAGVINFTLADASSGGLLSVKAGQYYDDDGETVSVSFNKGFSLTENGFVNIAGEFRQAQGTSRSVQRTDAQALIDAGNANVANPAQIWGTPEEKDDAKFSLNAGLALNETDQAYMFLNWATREIEGGFYFRNPHTRQGVNGGPLVDGRPTLLVGDLDGLNQGVECPTVFITDNNVLDDDDYLKIADNTTDVGKKLFRF